MLNRVVLIGRLTRDPELRRTSNNMAVASFTIAVDDSYRRADNERNTLFMNCSIFGNRAENVTKFTRKGSLVAVEGRLNQRKYTRKDGVSVTTIDTICDSVEFLDPKGANASNNASAMDSGYAADMPAVEDEDASIDVTDDDLPF